MRLLSFSLPEDDDEEEDGEDDFDLAARLLVLSLSGDRHPMYFG